MNNKKISLLALAVVSFLGSSAVPASQSLVNQISHFGVRYEVTDNQAALHGVDCAALGADWASCNRATITLTNNGPTITSKNWAIYMSNVHKTLAVESDQFRMVHIVGDLTRLEPTEKFAGIAAGASIAIPIVNEYWQLFITDVMPRWYVTSGDASPQIIKVTDTEDLTSFVAPFGDQWKSKAEDKNILMQANSRFTKNHDIKQLAPDDLRGQITPTPLKVVIAKDDADLSNGVHLELASLPAERAEAVRQRFSLLGISLNKAGYPVSTRIDPAALKDIPAQSGAYRLVINKDRAEVTGYDEQGVFYGLQSIMSLLPADGSGRIATLKADDAPRFAYRGIFLDVGRNFHSKAAILRMLDQMAAWKVNVFHFHLTDDEGWRIEIPGLPELTEVGGRRCHDLKEQRCLLPQLGSGPFSDNNGSGYFSRQDYIEIVKFAKARGIQVLPEVDMPAHARAAVIAMEARYQRLKKAGQDKLASEYRLVDPEDDSNTTSVQLYDRTSYLNPCLDSSLHFADKVISEIQLMHHEAGQPLRSWHFGGDEAKNIRLGPGYTDIKRPEAGKGQLDMSREDLPWAKSPVCQGMIASGKVSDLAHLPSYFALKVSGLLKQHGINRMQAWQDGLKNAEDAHAFATPEVAVNFWDTLYWGGFDTVNDWANKGYQVIISNPDYLYMDFPYEVNPLERGYYWGTRFSDERKMFSFAPDNLPQNAETSTDRDGHYFSAKSDKAWPGAAGMSAQLWSETVRTDDNMEYMMFPRLFSLAERAWHRASWEQDYQAGKEYRGGETHWVDQQALLLDWQRFANILGQRELAKLEKHGIRYRLPVPGARIVSGKLEANTALPGVEIAFSTDDGKSWQRYDRQNPPLVKPGVKIRSVSADGQRFSREESL
ncbi:beta-N-acetylhexosaminidase [Erwinia sorbitola]|uniref:beta-N-acetylhexosaminidase n=1 Tax=Erwinia sorbitola TaxID=2681984 RepID=A0A6I6F3I4_9GAMM|nr:beta-N-acetylhexosaminidase [Erwinia sorbitola]QGU88400.1 family 20 glycosylhydrolase [Erwinia sorbitola]